MVPILFLFEFALANGGYYDTNCLFLLGNIELKNKANISIDKEFLEIKIKTHSPQFYSIKYSYLRGMNFYNNDHRYLVIIALFKKAKFCEIDVNYLKREHGNSKFSNLKIFGAIFDTYKLILRLKARKY